MVRLLKKAATKSGAASKG